MGHEVYLELVGFDSSTNRELPTGVCDVVSLGCIPSYDRRTLTMWDKPAFIEVDMNAEIGGYQGEPGDAPAGPDPLPEFCAPLSDSSES
jgi:hypothetical protein